MTTRGEHGPSVFLLRGLFFVAMGGTGAWLPFLALRLDGAGYSGAAVGLLLAAMPLARLVSAPGWAMVADRFQQGGRALQVASFLSVAAAAALLAGDALWIVAPALVVYAAVRGPVGPLLDAQAVRALLARGSDTRHYGRIRLWGSLGFLVSGFVAGAFADGNPGAPLAIALAMWTVGALMTLRLPATGGGGPAPIGPALRALATRPFFLPFIGAAVLHGAALSSYDSLFAVHVRRLGLPSQCTGWALVTGISVELGVMAAALPLMRRCPPFALVAAAMAVGSLRWGLTAWLDAAVPLVATQALHGISFGAFWVGSVEALRQRSPELIRSSTQALLTSSAYGLGPLLSAGLATFLLDGAGTRGLFAVGAGLSATAALLVGWAARLDRSEGGREPISQAA